MRWRSACRGAGSSLVGTMQGYMFWSVCSGGQVHGSVAMLAALRNGALAASKMSASHSRSLTLALFEVLDVR
jgi:hypothetical protein